MFDWKIIGASAVALVFVSTVLLGNFGITGLISDVFGDAGEWITDSPLTGIFPSSSGKIGDISIHYFSKKITLSPSTSINILSGDTNITGFSGDISIDLEKNEIILIDPKTSLEINLGMHETIFSNVKLSKLLQEDADFRVEPDIGVIGGTLEMKNFQGEITVPETADKIIFNGTVSNLNVNTADQNWQLV